MRFERGIEIASTSLVADAFELLKRSLTRKRLRVSLIDLLAGFGYFVGYQKENERKIFRAYEKSVRDTCGRSLVGKIRFQCASCVQCACVMSVCDV